MELPAPPAGQVTLPRWPAGAGRTFIVGAHEKEFGRPPVEPHLPDGSGGFEAARAPWAIHGSASGGGLEIAMGRRFRLIVSGGWVGLPEVTPALAPGVGGTVRTPRFAWRKAAVELVHRAAGEGGTGEGAAAR